MRDTRLLVLTARGSPSTIETGAGFGKIATGCELCGDVCVSGGSAARVNGSEVRIDLYFIPVLVSPAKLRSCCRMYRRMRLSSVVVVADAGQTRRCCWSLCQVR
jgi:hypothetical protein